ncbi:4-hydroxybenzoate octaprenyltransferase [Candidatus Blochmannia ocreatus (nom. nud.)]|uniref:4-hydroxybenzoate octaprenyltransferase n=1 Tax=Candidatus Blochmannia ocreatus (nom. nud.) TaxID=251538 RepID=A0ABY4SUP1_9ENTR|nr:4-hydroxybenzoate octaprenyltransferase [Candidatus Blochmannia ocreatus]URJ25119.1 4-hydroxybenzoate octaprenyltransferase [Candidatus Blochmannia ocreatus]
MSNRLTFIKKCYNLAYVMRVNQPIGFFLLLWPTLWGLWLSKQGIPDTTILVIFIIGVICMRSAGCIINDYVDYKVDSCITRTKGRPLTTGQLSKKGALIALVVLLIIAFILILYLNVITIFLSLIALILSVVYPYLKRYTYFPQVVLGILFSWPILMTFTAIDKSIDSIMLWLLFLMNFLWVIVYDTQYAMLDREDDKEIGIRSLAVFLGNMDTLVIGILQFFIVFILGIIGYLERFFIEFYIFSLCGVIMLFIWQQMLIRTREKKNYFRAFLSNNYVGMLIFLGIFISFY